MNFEIASREHLPPSVHWLPRQPELDSGDLLARYMQSIGRARQWEDFHSTSARRDWPHCSVAKR